MYNTYMLYFSLCTIPAAYTCDIELWQWKLLVKSFKPMHLLTDLWLQFSPL